MTQALAPNRYPGGPFVITHTGMWAQIQRDAAINALRLIRRSISADQNWRDIIKTIDMVADDIDNGEIV